MYKISYVSDGTTTDYAFSFPFFQDADVMVALDNRTLGRDKYAVIINSDFTGGTVIFAAAPDVNTNIDIFRHISLSRVVDYQPISPIVPEDLNTDFNFLLEAFRDFNTIDIDMAQWANTHDSVMQFLNYNLSVINDKLGGGGVMGLYNNLLNVLNDALPKLVNDYGSVTDSVNPNISDDYGVL